MCRLSHAFSLSFTHVGSRFFAIAAVAALFLVWTSHAAAQTVPPNDPFLGVPILTSGASTPGGPVTVTTPGRAGGGPPRWRRAGNWISLMEIEASAVAREE